MKKFMPQHYKNGTVCTMKHNLSIEPLDLNC